MKEQGEDLKEQIKDFIIETFMSGKGSLKDDQPLFASGIIDSLGFIKLLAFIQKTFHILIEMNEVTIEKFNTINDIEKIITDKLSRLQEGLEGDG
jgi:acyl carrier protein